MEVNRQLISVSETNVSERLWSSEPGEPTMRPAWLGGSSSGHVPMTRRRKTSVLRGGFLRQIGRAAGALEERSQFLAGRGG